MTDVTLYKVLGDKGVAHHGGSGRWHLPHGKRPGKWMPAVKGDIALCSNGYHLIPATSLLEWLGPTLYEAEGRGDQQTDSTKLAFREARLIRKFEHWNDRNARLFAADCAARALNRWREDFKAKRLQQDVDPRSHAAVVIARQLAIGGVDEAAWSAAESAARLAAESAAWSAAESAARLAAESAAWSAARLAATLAAESAAGSAAEAAGESAAWSAAWSAEKAWQNDRLFQYLNGREPDAVPLPPLQGVGR